MTADTFLNNLQDRAKADKFGMAGAHLPSTSGGKGAYVRCRISDSGAVRFDCMRHKSRADVAAYATKMLAR